MNKKVKEKWVAALRSGEYEQGRFLLRKEVGGRAYYCCLGVLAHLAYQDGVCKFDGLFGVYDERREFLGKNIMKWAGVRYFNPSVNYLGVRISLQSLNDNHQLSFEQIADLIEEQL